MSKQHYILKIDTPCEQEWDSMTQTDLGKFCHHCTKTVVDFTKLTDQEVLQIIEKNSGKLCGRLTQKQLNRVIQVSQPTDCSLLHNTLAALLLASASTNLSVAKNPDPPQGIIHIINDSKTYTQSSEIKSEIYKDSLNVIQGSIIDSKTNEKIPSASIYIKGTKTGVASDANGKFRLVISDHLLTEKIHLVIAFPGYESNQIVLHKKDLPITKDFSIAPDERPLTGEVVVIKKKKWWQRKKIDLTKLSNLYFLLLIPTFYLSIFI